MEEIRLPEESKIVGFYFDSDKKFRGYIYNDYIPEHAINKVYADEQLVDAIIQAHKECELCFDGEFETSLTINDISLFRKAEAIIVEDGKGNELLELKLAMAEMVEEKDAEILELKLALAEIVEGVLI